MLLEVDNYKRLAQYFTNNLQIIYNRVNYELDQKNLEENLAI